MATDTVSRVIPFPTYAISEGVETGYPCPGRREVTEPAKILQFPEHPEIFEEMRRVRDVFGDEPWENYLSEKKYLDGGNVLQFFRSKGFDDVDQGILLCRLEWTDDRKKILIKLNEKDRAGRRRYAMCRYRANPSVRDDSHKYVEYPLARRAEGLYKRSLFRFAPFE